MSNMLASIIIISAGSKDYLDALTDSINKQTYRNIEVITMDNFKTGASYCGALNDGIHKSRGDFILCLNDDVVLDERFIQEALKGFEINELIGMVSGKILRPDKKTIDSAGLFLSRYRTAKERGYGAQDRGQFEKEGYIFGVTGAVAFYRKKMLEDIKKIGTVPLRSFCEVLGLASGDCPYFFEYFDSRFRFFYEDLDVAWRAQKKGWRGYYAPSAIAYHIRGGTTRSASGINKRFARCYISDKLQIDLIKNRYLTIIKNDTLSGFLLNLPFILAYEIILWIYLLFFFPCQRAVRFRHPRIGKRLGVAQRTK